SRHARTDSMTRSAFPTPSDPHQVDEAFRAQTHHRPAGGARFGAADATRSGAWAHEPAAWAPEGYSNRCLLRVGTSTATTCGELRTRPAGASGTPTWRRCLGRCEGARRPGPGSASSGVRLDLLGPGE